MPTSALARAVALWRRTDPVLADLATGRHLQWRPEDEPDRFRALVRAIVHQQVSFAAGRTIYGRLEGACRGVDPAGVTPAAILGSGEPALRGAGLSRAKTAYCLDLAGKVLDGSLDLEHLDRLADEEVVAGLTQVKGIGVWSAKMYMIFQMGRTDVCPWEDLGVRLAVERFYGVPRDGTSAWIRDEARPRWSPYNSLAARVLWDARRD